MARDALSKSETVTIAAVEQGVPLLVEAREIITAFHTMIRKKARADLDPWLERACASLVASFANGITKDKAAIDAAITTTWSNGQTEGQITKLKCSATIWMGSQRQSGWPFRRSRREDTCRGTVITQAIFS